MNFPKLQRTHNLDYVSFGPRLVAESIDGLIYLFWMPLTVWYLAGSSVHTIVSDLISAFALIILPASFFNIASRVFLLHHSGQTFGKMLVGIEVLNAKKEPLTWKRAFFRETLGKTLSTYVLWAGQLSVLFDVKHQAWHDHLVGSFVYAKSKSVGLGIGVAIVLLVGYGFVFKMSINKFRVGFLPEIQAFEKAQSQNKTIVPQVRYVPQKTVPHIDVPEY